MRLIIFFLLISFAASAQKPHSKIFTNDIDLFWSAYDSVKANADSSKYVNILQRLYVDRGSQGLKAFMKSRGYSAASWAFLIRQYPKFWQSIRGQTLTINNHTATIDSAIWRLKKLYPPLRRSTIYFTIGGLHSGGAAENKMVLIGAEIATGSPSTDVSEFKDDWLATTFQQQDSNNLVGLVMHEYVHTQQKGTSRNLLAQAIKEGSCEFISELVTGIPLRTAYIIYGKQNDKTLKEEFRQQMFTAGYAGWLYNGSKAPVADLGYYIGYAICRSYYERTPDKKRAIREMIRLNYSDNAAVVKFLNASGFYTEKVENE